MANHGYFFWFYFFRVFPAGRNWESLAGAREDQSSMSEIAIYQQSAVQVTALSASIGCSCLSRGSQGDESETDHSDDGVAEQIVA